MPSINLPAFSLFAIIGLITLSLNCSCPEEGGGDRTEDEIGLNESVVEGRMCSFASSVSSVPLQKIPSAYNINSIAAACTDGIALLTREASVRLMGYPSIESGDSCTPEDDYGRVGDACLPGAIESSSDNGFFAASFGKKHLLYFSSESASLSLLELDREWSDFAFSPQSKYLIVLDQEGYLNWFDVNNSFNRIHSFPLRSRPWYTYESDGDDLNPAPLGNIIATGFDDDISSSQWPAFNFSERYIFVLRTETGSAGVIYRIPLNNEDDPSGFLKTPQVGDAPSSVADSPIGLIRPPLETVPGGSDSLIPSDLLWSGLVDLGPRGAGERGRLYITHENSGAVRICEASEPGTDLTPQSSLNFIHLPFHLNSDSGGSYQTTEFYGPAELEAVSSDVCNTLENGLGLNADPEIKNSELNRFVYFLDSDNNLKIINNDYYYLHHIDHGHYIFDTYAVLPLTLKASSLASFYYYEEPYTSLPYYPRNRVEAGFTASLAVLDGTKLRYFKESSPCFFSGLGECLGGADILKEDDIHTKPNDLTNSDLAKVTLIGDYAFYLYEEDDSLKFARHAISYD